MPRTTIFRSPVRRFPPAIAMTLGLALTLPIPSLAPAGVDHEAIRRERIERLLPEAMATHDVDMWLTLTRENTPDPLLSTLGVDHIVARAAFVFVRQPGGAVRRIAIAASYDIDAIGKSGLYDPVISYKSEGIKPHLAGVVIGARPGNIALNMSRDVTIADGLTVGLRDYLQETLGARYAKRFVSSERLVVSLLGRKLPAEIDALREAAEATQRIIAEALTSEVINPGVTTERGLDTWMIRRAEELGYGVAFSSVVVGPSRGHSDATERTIEPGDVIRIDWGVSNDGYAADIQRTAYVLRPGETQAPAWLRTAWGHAVSANRAAVKACRPGNTGNDVDRAGREAVTGAGYDEYPHGTGHAIGMKVHDVGPMLGPDWRERYGEPVFFTIEKDQVFAIEPIIYFSPPEIGYATHVALEEDVIVTESGAEIIGEPQTELILVGGAVPRSRAGASRIRYPGAP